MVLMPLTAAWAAKRQKVEPSYAWTISQPLGLHFPGTIDTLQYNYYRSVVPLSLIHISEPTRPY